MQHGDFAKADNLLTSAISATQTDTTGCNGAEAAIYHEDLQVRLARRPFESVVVSFDSGPGDANPQGGTDRHTLYAALTQELIGAYILVSSCTTRSKCKHLVHHYSTLCSPIQQEWSQDGLYPASAMKKGL